MDTMMVKTCPKCENEKSVDAFYRERGRPRFRCKACDQSYQKSHRESDPLRYRNQKLKFLYGIDLTAYNALLAKQEGKCAICLSRVSNGRSTFLEVDHDHSTGEIRGLLCHGCNSGIGNLRDDPKRVRQALKYLEGKV